MTVTPSTFHNPSFVQPRAKLRIGQLWILIGLIAAAGLMRLFASGGDLWMGEVSSWQIARHVTSPMQILTSAQAQTDRNHPLNTLVFYVLGERSFWAVYRLLSMACGIGSVVLAGWILLRHSMIAAILGTLLVGCSYAMLTYSAEASGYAPMVFFALVAYWAMQRCLEKPSTVDLVIFNVACILGFLSHVCFVQFYLAALVYWSYVSFGRNRAKAVGSILAGNLAPIVFFVIYFLVFIRHLPVANVSALAPILSALSLIVGGPAEPELLRFAGYIAVVTIVAFIAALDWLRTRQPEGLIWYGMVLVVAPAVQLIVLRRPGDFSLGYFLIPIVFALLLFATRLAAMMEGSERERYLAIGLVAAMLLGNFIQIGHYLVARHTQYSDAMYYMGSHTEDPLVTVAVRSTSDDLNAVDDMLNFYARTLPEGKTLGLEQRTENLPAPQWLVVKSSRVGGPTPELSRIVLQYVGTRGATYVFDHEFAYYGLSGSSWEVYRLEVGR